MFGGVLGAFDFSTFGVFDTFSTFLGPFLCFWAFFDILGVLTLFGVFDPFSTF